LSLPARELPSPRPPRGPRSEPARVLKPKRRKQHQVGFAVLASVVVGLLVLSIVVLHVLLAQQSFRIDEAERRAEVLRQEHLGLVTQQATLSAPGRIAAWAARHGMRLPDDIRILRASDDPGDPTGTGSASVGEERR
jgi:cell division protein FtsL